MLPGENIIPVIQKLADYFSTKGEPATNLRVFDKAVRERRAALATIASSMRATVDEGNPCAVALAGASLEPMPGKYVERQPALWRSYGLAPKCFDAITTRGDLPRSPPCCNARPVVRCVAIATRAGITAP
jgi:hypothetical protein